MFLFKFTLSFLVASFLHSFLSFLLTLFLYFFLVVKWIMVYRRGLYWAKCSFCLDCLLEHIMSNTVFISFFKCAYNIMVLTMRVLISNQTETALAQVYIWSPWSISQLCFYLKTLLYSLSLSLDIYLVAWWPCLTDQALNLSLNYSTRLESSLESHHKSNLCQVTELII